MNIPDNDIIERTLNNEATPDEAKMVIRWFKTKEGQLWLSSRIDEDEKLILEGEEHFQVNHKIPSDVIYSNILKRLKTQKLKRRIFQAAALLIPFILVAASFFYVNSKVDLLAVNEYDEIYVPKGERMQVIFQDGSKVYLNSESRIRYPRKFGLNERKVELEGEGWFDIAKNPNRPFIVDLNCLRVKVMGTIFDVKAYPNENDISVVLESGSVELKTVMSNSINMIPGDKAVYNRSSGRCKILHPDNYKLSSAWKQNVLVFNNSSLSDVIVTLSRAYNVNFIVEDSVALSYTYTITTNSKNLAFLLKELEMITPVRFIINENDIRVKMIKK